MPQKQGMRTTRGNKEESYKVVITINRAERTTSLTIEEQKER